MSAHLTGIYGPWKHFESDCGWVVADESNRHIATITDSTGLLGPHDEAIARFVAAAPHLSKTCQTLVEELMRLQAVVGEEDYDLVQQQINMATDILREAGIVK